MLGISTTNLRVNGFRGGIDADAKAIYNRIIADSGVSNLSRLNYLVKGLKTIYGSLLNTPVCYDAHWIGYQPANGVGATSGQACAKLYSLTVAGDAIQATASAQPLLLAHNGAVTDNYWYGSGVSGNYVSTPNAVANQITEDIEIIAKISVNSNTSYGAIIGKFSSNGYLVFLDSLKLQFYKSTNPADYAFASTNLSSLYSGWVKITYTAINGNVKFFTSSDGITYNQLGTTKTITIGSIPNTSLPLIIGAYDTNGISGSNNIRISRATISSTIGGTPVVDFNPANYNAATSQTQWTSSTSEVWTISTGTATSGYKGALVDRTIVMFDKVDDNMIMSSNINLESDCAIYSSTKQFINNQLNILFSYGVAANDYLVIYNDNLNAHTVQYFTPTLQKILTSSGQNNSLLINSELINSSTIYSYLNNNLQNTSSNSAIPNVTDSPIILGRLTTTSFYGNFNLNTLILSNIANNSTTRTAMYNFIKSLNNNAF